MILGYKGGICIRRKIKINNTLYNIGVYKYYNGRIRLIIENYKESHDITINMDDFGILDGYIFLNPIVINNGLIKTLKKTRIIRDITGVSYYGNVAIPIAKLNMGILKQYDYKGVSKYLARGVKNK